MRTLISATALAVVMTLGLSACENPAGQAAAQTAQNLVRPGLGEDPGSPDVTPFALPEGVRVIGEIKGADEVDGECENEASEPSGSGNYVRICVPLENMTGTPVQIEFPAGLLVVATSEGRAQNGLLIERTLITVPPTQRGGGGCRRPDERRAPRVGETAQDPCAYVVRLNLYCLNEARDPSNPFITYAFAGVTRDVALQEILSMLEGKTIKGEENVGAVQDALYSITEGRGLTRMDRAAMNAL